MHGRVSEPPLIAAPSQVLSVGVVQHACTMGELMEVEVASIVQLQEHWSVDGQCYVSGLRADAREHFGGGFDHTGQLFPKGDVCPNDRLKRVRVRAIDFQVGAAAMDDPSDPAACEIDSAQAIAAPPVVVGWIYTCGDLGDGAMDDRAFGRNEHEEPDRPKAWPKAF